MATRVNLEIDGKGKIGIWQSQDSEGEERHVGTVRDCIVKQVWNVACVSRCMACQVGGPCEGLLALYKHLYPSLLVFISCPGTSLNRNGLSSLTY
jgi:hypothetical protein